MKSINTIMSLLALTAAGSASAFTYNLGTDEQVAFSAIQAAAGTDKSIQVAGPADEAAPNSYAYLDSDASLSYFKLSQGATIKMEGNYTFAVSGITDISKRNKLTQGVATMVLSGTSASERLTYNATGKVNIGCDTNNGDVSIIMNGNVSFNAAVRFQMGHVENYTSSTETRYGKSTVIMRGENNALKSQSLCIGNTTCEVGCESVLQIEGSTQQINFAPNQWGYGFKVLGTVNSTVDNLQGGAIKFVADELGVSTINANYTQSATADFTNGVFILDLTNYNFTSDTADFTLISSTNSSVLNALNTWKSSIDGGRDLFGIVGDNVTDYELLVAADGLYVSVTSVPEPATYAAMFGALALLMVFIRRRK